MAKYIDFALVGELVVHGDVHYEDLKRLPAADVQEVRRAKWEYKQAYKGASFGFCVCSACGKAQWTPDAKYCPNCGAAMKGPNENE